MDRRTVYLQELPQVSDFLMMQRHVQRALAAMAYSLFGRNTVACTIDPSTGPTTKPVPGTNLRVVVPAITIYQMGVMDAATWSTLGADATALPQQGINFAATTLALNGSPDSALSIGAGNSIYYLVEGQIASGVDENLVVLPYYPLIQMVTVSGSSTSVLKVNSNVGVSTGDAIIVSGIATVNGGPATVLSTTGTDTITLNAANLLVSAPGTGVGVRDVTPNSGHPLIGPANSGTAQAIDRSAHVTLQIKAGTAAVTPTVPAVDSGFAPLFTVLLANGATGVVSGNIDFAPNSPFFPSLVGTSHHKGVPGQALKIDTDVETVSPPVKRVGDTMTGALTMPGQVSAGPSVIFNTFPAAPGTAGGGTGFETVAGGFMDLLSGAGLRWNAPGATYAPVPFTRFKSGTSGHTSGSAETVNVGFTPAFVILIITGGTTGFVNFLFSQSDVNGHLAVSSTLFTYVETGAVGVLAASGFTFNSSQATGTYRWFAWG